MPGVQSQRQWFQFGIGTLLFLTCCTAGFLAGYRGGFQVGAAAKVRRGVHARIYDLKDIVGFPPNDQSDGDALIRFIELTISPQSWAQRGGPGSIAYDASSRAIVVSNNLDAHLQVADVLEQIRRLRRQSRWQAMSLDKFIASVNEESAPTPIPTITVTSNSSRIVKRMSGPRCGAGLTLTLLLQIGNFGSCLIKCC